MSRGLWLHNPFGRQKKIKITYLRSKEDENIYIDISHPSFSGRKQTHKITRIVLYSCVFVFIFYSLRRVAGAAALFWRENQCTVLTKSGFKVSQRGVLLFASVPFQNCPMFSCSYSFAIFVPLLINLLTMFSSSIKFVKFSFPVP